MPTIVHIDIPADNLERATNFYSNMRRTNSMSALK
ncbi:VOC family protein [uncultured Methanomethylovorans sp.]